MGSPWDHWKVRRFVPWFLLGLMGLTTGLGVGLGTSPNPSASQTDPPSTQADRTTIPAPRFDVPVFQTGCATKEPSPGVVVRVTMRVTRSGPLTFEFVPVCIDGRGPFPFILDTGASVSVVDTALARTLELTPSGAPEFGSGVNCVARVEPSQLATWSLGDVPLAPQKIAVVNIPLFGAQHAPAGLIGSDVLSRFGSVRLDFRSQLLSVDGAEGTVIGNDETTTGPVSSAIHSSRSQGDRNVTVPLSVVASNGEVEATVDVRIGNTQQRFALDTGSGRSAIATSFASFIALRPTRQSEMVVTAGCMSKGQLVESGSWSIGAMSLRPKSLLEVSLGTVPVAGLLGSDELLPFGWIVIDYQKGELLLG